jgi:hypothetical protein
VAGRYWLRHRAQAQPRNHTGRFVPRTLEHTAGLRAPVCPYCRGFNPHGLHETPPDRCVQCGKSVARDKWR